MQNRSFLSANATCSGRADTAKATVKTATAKPFFTTAATQAAGLPAIYEDVSTLGHEVWLPGTAVSELHVYDITYLHYHSALEIGWCVSGCGECYVENQVFPFSAGDVQLIFPFQKHYNRSSPGQLSCWHFISLDLYTLLPALGFFTPSFVEEWLQQEMGLFGVITADAHKSVHELIIRFCQEVLTPEKHLRHRELCGALLCQLLVALSRCSAGLPKLCLRRNPVLMQVSPALRQIQTDLFQGVQPSVTALAKSCAMSEPNFRRVFRRATGSAPKEYILCAAIYRAQQLLLTTDREIISIAAEVGFSDVSGLNRQFLRKNGVSPNTFRKQHPAARKAPNNQECFKSPESMDNHGSAR